MSTGIDLDELRARTPLMPLVARRVELSRAARDWKGCCPFHAEKTASFVVYEDNHFHCFGCQAHGDQIEFIRRIEGVTFIEACNRLAAEAGMGPGPSPRPKGNGAEKGEVWQPMVPPAGAPKPTERQLQCDMLHEYFDTGDRLLCYVRRFEANGGKGKRFLPLTYGRLNGKLGWHDKAPTQPKPLYGLHRLSHTAPDATVLLCEGEKSADAAQHMYPDMVGMSWMGGANADGGADLSPIAGHPVMLWPDADKVGRDVMQRIAKRLPGSRIINTDGLPGGFDAADLEALDVDPVEWLAARTRVQPEETPSPAEPPTIIVRAGERHLAADVGLAAMHEGGVPFYRRDKDLVRIVRIKLKLSNGHDVLVPAVVPVIKPTLMRALGLAAQWQKFNHKCEQVSIDPPPTVAEQILGMIGEWPFPPLRGVIATQTMRYDGTLLTKPGYDPATGLVLFNPPPMPPISDQPTKAEALDALALLKDLLAEVDFAEDGNVSLSGAISMMMTPVLRGMMGVAPMHVVSKPDAGTGGSYMQDITAAIAIGERCPVLSLTLNNDEENDKRLSSAALTGQPIIAIDNFTGTLMGDFLCQLIERPMPQVRLLGRSELVTITNNHCVIANGNNVTIGADTVRRTVQINLDANMENPATRTFTRNPVAEILADRGRYVAAILTIARAYRVAGSPGKLPPRLSFEDWSDNVRSPLVWLGCPDPDESIKAMRAADPIGAKLHAVIAAWAADLMVGTSYLTSELVTAASECLPYSADRIRPALWDALFAVAGSKTGQLDAARLGLWLQAHLNRVSAGHKLLVDRTNKARPRWLLERR